MANPFPSVGKTGRKKFQKPAGERNPRTGVTFHNQGRAMVLSHWRAHPKIDANYRRILRGEK